MNSNGIARSGTRRRKVNLRHRETVRKPPRHSVRKNVTTERTIHGLTIPKIAQLKRNNAKGYIRFISSLTHAEFLDVMELDMFGELNVA